MNKDLVAIFEYLEREKGIKRDVVVEAIKESLQAAAKKCVHGANNVKVDIHSKTGEIEVLCDKEVVDVLTNPVQEILLKEALKLDPAVKLGQTMVVRIIPKDFGRIAAQKARSIIAQKLKGAERDVIHDEYRHRIGEIVSGTVKRIGRGNVLIVDLGKVEGIIPAKHYPFTEKYQVGDKVLALLLEVRDTDIGGAEVVLSRSHPDFVKQLFVQEIPEISDETIVIEKIVREPGYRTKIIVRSSDQKIDPVGACIGMRGVRVKNIIRELSGEKIDVIPYVLDRVQLLQKALHPVEIRSLRTNEDESEYNVVVKDDDFATAIGKKGLNVRLIGHLIGAQLSIQKESDYQKIQALERLNFANSLDPALDEAITHIEGISSLLVDQIVQAGFITPRKLLLATPEELKAIPGISLDTAEKILNALRTDSKTKGISH